MARLEALGTSGGVADKDDHSRRRQAGRQALAGIGIAMARLARLAVAALAALAALGAAQDGSELSIDDGSDEEVVRVCSALVPGWAELPPEQLALTQLVGGITNLLWRVDVDGAWCAAADGRICSVLVRRYGDGSEMLIDRKRETAVLRALSDAGFDVALVAAFSNGRVEKWLEGWKALTMEEMRDPQVASAVAGQVARLHSTAPEAVPGISPEDPALWRQLRSWLKQALALEFPEGGAKAAALRTVELGRIAHEIDTLELQWRRLQRAGGGTQAPVFAHNDMLNGNIMIKQMARSDPDWPQVILIDFEYSDYNFRAFDIGNYFHEWAGFDCEWEEFPSEATQRAFIARYLASLAERNAAYTEAAAEQLYREVQVLGLASNLYWGLWGVLQAQYSTLDFDYLGYSARRLTRFRKVSAQVYAEVTAATGDADGDGVINKEEMSGLAKEIMENAGIKGPAGVLPGGGGSGMSKLAGVIKAAAAGLKAQLKPEVIPREHSDEDVHHEL
jgi:ethanolamine kinase